VFTDEALPEVIALLGLIGLLAYAALGAADFGGGIWNLLASGPRAREQRNAIAEAIGPVWEANHVWLIFIIVILFTGFPPGFALLSIALFWPFHLVLAGIVMRGAAFVFRAHGHEAARAPLVWGHVFGAASMFTPLLLGASLGAISAGGIRVMDRTLAPGSEWAWLGLFPLATGILALAICAYLAAVYLTVETRGELREDFRRRALGVWLAGGAISIGVLLLTYLEAPRLWSELTGGLAAVAVVAGVLLAPASGLALLRRRFELARVLAVGQVILILTGWALAQRPYLIYPDVTLTESAAPEATLMFVLWTIPLGMALLLPSLWYLFAVFKGRNPAVED
jgi:cytochrome bd ubiquinol oxidase subunit II